ncbi:MAG: serpin family protein [Candidatus Omnitrophica bacterium]|nr:serpin family protein [Candidatus Omnitrophota bacterium]
MKTKGQILIGVLWSVLLLSAGYAQPAADPVVANNKFAFDLYDRMSSKDGNIFFSPYSLSSALSMTYEGAKGQTADEMRSALHLPPDDAARRGEVSAFIQSINREDKAYELSTANALWAQKAFPFKADYLNLVKNTYFAEARNLDFVSNPEGARVTINGWVSDNTKNRINNLLPSRSITTETRLVLTNAVYFKGKWSVPFKKKNTKPEAFWLDPDHSVQTDMMMLVGESFDYIDNDQAQLLKISYQGEAFSMLIILPRSKNLQVLEKALTSDTLMQWQMVMMPQKVNIFLPKFKLDFHYEMKGILIGMGMKLAFDMNNADFSSMADLKPDEHLYVDQVYHKAWIDTSEEGTEAAAATAVVMKLTMSARPIKIEPKIFRADHPFIFIIQDNRTKQILFMGRVNDPREK